MKNRNRKQPSLRYLIFELWQTLVILPLYGVRNISRERYNDIVLEFINRIRNAPYHQFYRNVLAKYIKKYKPVYAIDKSENWAENKKKYYEYQKNNPLNNASLVKPGMWVTIISEAYPVKGNRFFEYYENRSSYPKHRKTFQVEKVYNSGAIAGTYYDSKSEVSAEAEQIRVATYEEVKWAKVNMENYISEEENKNTRIIIENLKQQISEKKSPLTEMDKKILELI